MRYKKTYGVRSMLEWKAIIKLGNASLCVPFEGGSITAYGTNPASYTTDKEFVQKAIEDSNYFQSGKIQLVKTEAIEDAVEDVKDEPVSEVSELKEVEVSDVDEAKEYLIDKFGFKAAQLRSMTSINKAAEMNGVKFVGI